MLTGKLLGKADWLEDMWLFVVWNPRERPTQEDVCPFLQNGKAEIKAFKYPFPSRPKVWKYFLAEKPEFIFSRNWAARLQ